MKNSSKSSNRSSLSSPRQQKAPRQHETEATIRVLEERLDAVFRQLPRTMSRAAFQQTLEQQLAGVVRLVNQRNAAYAGGDALKCWRKRGLAGMLVRLEDKLLRFDTFLENGGASRADWQELLSDIAGYGLCGLVWLAQGQDAVVKGETGE
jgi:hypothetical protein